MKRIAITGISGYIGSVLLSHLDSLESVDRIVGVDIKPPKHNSPKLQFHRQDISEPLGEIFAESQVDSAVHLTFVLKPTRDRRGARQVDIGGILNFLEACKEAGVRHILYLSSHTVYGAHPDNPSYLKEDSPLRPLPDFQYSWDKAETEKILRDFSASHPDVLLTILRTCPVIGPTGANAAAAVMFKPPFMLGVSGYDPLLQFVHEDDLAELIIRMLSQRRAGTYNVAADEAMRYSQTSKLCRKRMFSLPWTLLQLLMGLSWTLHLQNESPSSGLKFIKYPPALSTEKLKQETGFQFRYSCRDALLSFLSATALTR